MRSLKNWFVGLSIRWKIIGLVAINFLILSVGVLYYINFQARTLLYSNLETVLNQAIGSVSQESATLVQSSNWQELQDRASESINRKDIPVSLILFIDGEGNVQASAPKPAAKFKQPDMEEDTISRFQFENETVIGTMAPVPSIAGDGTAGYVAMALSTAPVNRNLASIMWWSSGIILLLAVAGMISIYYLTGVLIVKPFKSKANAIADGKLTDEVHRDIKLGGEIGESFESMRNNLMEVITEIRQYAEEAGATAQSVLSASEELNTVANQQNKQIEESSSAVTELSQSVQEVAQRAERGQEVAQNSQELAEEGGDAVAQAIDEMNTIQESVNQTAEEVEKLGESGDEIGKIVGVISQIAEQTSLLALNAAIEAARAGEQGKGFAVVADEVSRLADRVGESADEIEELIEQIQEQTDASVESMEEGTEQVKAGVQVVDEAGGVLEEIVSSALETREEMESIASSMKQQATASDEVANSVEKVSSSSEEVVSSAENLVEEGENLENLSSKMEEMVNRFDINDSDNSDSQ
jgi:methyl-accepting chemotaxis protein